MAARLEVEAEDRLLTLDMLLIYIRAVRLTESDSP